MFGLFRKKKTEAKGKAIPKPKPSAMKDPQALLKQATAQKKNGEIDKAVETLKEAYRAIATSGIDYSIDTYLRLPLYLQAANRNDEAWGEFNKLLTRKPPSYSSKALLLMEHHTIYDKMRLFLQRNKKHKEAVIQGVLSYLAIAQGRHYQVKEYKASKDELKQVSGMRSADFIGSRLEPLLKKSGDLDKQKEITEMLIGELGEFPKINKKEIIDKLWAILREEKS